MSEWKEYVLEDCMEAIIDYRGKTPCKTTYGVPLITARIVKNGRIETPNEFIAEEDYDNWMTRGLPQINDLIMTTEAPLGEVASIDEEYIALAQRVILLRGKKELLDNIFLRFLFQTPDIQNQLYNRATGTTVLGIKQSELRKITLPLPPLPVQKRIAEILGSLDEKIELNRRTSATLEQMAQALFRSWFVDFDPVKAKADGKRPKGLSSEVARLFPKEFVDSSLGPIPKGWDIFVLPAIFEVNPFRKLVKNELSTYLDMSNMPTQSALPSAWSRRKFGSGTKFTNGDTLVARITPCLENGKTAYVNFLDDDEVGWGSTEYIVLRPKGDIPPPFAYLLARTDEFRTFAIRQMTGSSGRQRVPSGSLANFFLSLPSENSPIYQHFGDAINPLFDRMESIVLESRTLSALRDTLLPKLMSGGVEV